MLTSFPTHRFSWPLRWAVPAVLLAALFKLAISDGGRHADSLAIVQIVIYLLAAALLWSGTARSAPLLIVLAVVGLTAATSVRPEASIRELLLWGLYGSVAVIASRAAPSHLRLVADGIAATAGWLCLLALFMHWGNATPGMRWYATFYWPNPFAGFLLLALPLTLMRFLRAERRREVLAQGGLALLLAVSLVMTYSRGAWAAFGAVLPLAVFLLHPANARAAASRLGVLTALGALAVALLTQGAPMRDTGQSLAARAASVASPGDYSIQGRLAFWRAALAIFADHPIMGTGPGTFGTVHPAYQREARYYARDAHGLYVQVLAEMGLAGAAAAAALLAALAAAWRRALRLSHGRGEQAIIAGAGLSLAAFLIHSGMEMNWMFPANPAAAFALAGLVAGYAPPERRLSAGRSPGRISSPQLAAAGALLAAAAVGWLWMGHREFAAAGRAARSGNGELALARYASAVRWNPISSRYLDTYATALARSAGASDPRVEPLFRRAMAVDRMNAALPLHAARLLLAGGEGGEGGEDGRTERWSEAERLLQRSLALDRFNRPETYRLLAGLYDRQGRPGDAAEVYDRALRLYAGQDLGRGSLLYFSLWPQVAALYLDAADFAAARGNLEEAARILESLLAEDPLAAGGLLRLSEIYERSGRREAAIALLRAGTARMPDQRELVDRLRALEGGPPP